MLKVQEYLRSFSNPDEALASLDKVFSIKSNRHPTDERVILNYDQIESPKFETIVRECRGLVLEFGTWNLIAIGFFRFFNYGEGTEEQNRFSFGQGYKSDDPSFFAGDKEDGSIILLYFYKGKWRVNTRASFADGKVNDSNYTWEELFWLGAAKLDKAQLVEGWTYVFELCSVYNKVVRHYTEPTVYLLSVFKGEEETSQPLRMEAFWLNVNYPKQYAFNTMVEVIAFIKDKETNDPTFEGLVLKDRFGNRLKIKSSTYLVLHKKLGNRKPSIEDLYTMTVVDDGGDEFLTYFPEIAEQLNNVKIRKELLTIEMLGLYEMNKNLESQKDFALAVKEHRMAFAAFALKKGLTVAEILVQYAKRISELIEKDLHDYPAPTNKEILDFTAEIRAGQSLPA